MVSLLMLPSLILIPTRLRHMGDKSQTIRAIRAAVSRQDGRTDGDLAAASRARAWPAERTLCFPQTERLVPRRTQIRLPLCNVRGGEQHGGSSEPPCTSGCCSERPSGSREIWPQMNKWHDIDGRSRAFCCILLYI